MKHFVDYLESGKPIIGLRTATHAFNYTRHKDSPYAKYSFNNAKFSGGFGRQVLGETWIDHYGHHNVESTRATIVPGMEQHPIVRGVGEIWGPSDVYAITTADRRQQAAAARARAGGHETDRPAQRKEEARAGRLDEDLHRRPGQGRRGSSRPRWATATI